MASWEHAQWHSKQLQSAAALKCIVRLRLCKHARCTPPRPCVNTRSLVRQDSGIRATAQRPAAFAAERASTHFCRPLRNTALISWSLRTCNNCLKPVAGSCQPRPAELPAKKWCGPGVIGKLSSPQHPPAKPWWDISWRTGRRRTAAGASSCRPCTACTDEHSTRLSSA